MLIGVSNFALINRIAGIFIRLVGSAIRDRFGATKSTIDVIRSGGA